MPRSFELPRQARGTINSVLRQMTVQFLAGDIELIYDFFSGTEIFKGKDLATGLSHPQWIVKRWMRRYGPKEAIELMYQNNSKPVYHLRLRKDRKEQILNELKEINCEISEAKFLKDEFIKIDSGLQHIIGGDLISSGEIIIQDVSSGLIVELLDPQPGEKIADICSSPGEKTLHMASRMDNEGQIVAMDLNSTSLEKVMQKVDICGYSEIVQDYVLDVRKIRDKNKKVVPSKQGSDSTKLEEDKDVEKSVEDANDQSEIEIEKDNDEDADNEVVAKLSLKENSDNENETENIQEKNDDYENEEEQENERQLELSAQESNSDTTKESDDEDENEEEVSQDSILNSYDSEESDNKDASENQPSQTGQEESDRENEDEKTIKADILMQDVLDKFSLFDKVLLDAPCSGFGLLNKRAELRWQITPKHVKKYIVMQRKLLQGAAKLVRPGGLLVYCTNTLEPEENQRQVAFFLENNEEYTLEKPPENLLPSEVVSEEGWLQTFPHKHNIDGVFAVRLRKKEESG
eukprot:TRINITY_DN41332_c0_g1_i1.p1 TRINITY_DN41332_c0_g1~~TRINITY_DN41332_c0_g1_i1.p1  ORF type:complete len:547 (-),score=84.32 TRINITY_DN41332_c0_g1_i1:516-2075(-)